MRYRAILILVSFFIIQFSPFAQAAQEDFTPVTAAKNFYVDPYSGSANFVLPISMPKARGRLPQKLNLVYSSRASNGWLGAGWKLDLAVIERSTKNGYPKYDATDKFNFSLGEQQEELVSIGSSLWRAKTAGVAWKFAFDGQRWTVKDNSGTTYYFGLDDKLADSSRTKDASGRVFRWRLSKITDTSGNNIIFKYSADKIEIYYSEKTEAAKSSYKSQDYNYLVSINFSGDRQDKVTSYRPGFADNYPLDGAGRVSSIKVSYRGQQIKRYALDYKYSSTTGRSILSSITEFGTDDKTVNPPVQFNYSTSAFEYKTTHHIPAIYVGMSNSDWRTPWRIRFVNNFSQPKGKFTFTPDGLVDDGGMFNPMSWSRVYNTESGSESGFSWSVKPSASDSSILHNKIGNLRIDGKRGQIFHTWTYIVFDILNKNQGNKQYVVAGSNNCNAVYYLSGDSGQSGPYPLSQPISFGYLIKRNAYYIFRIDIIGYNFSDDFNMEFNIAENLSYEGTISSTAGLSDPHLSGDFNGDGATDLGEVNWNGASRPGINVSLSNKRDYEPISNWSPSSLDGFNDRLVGDFDGDGKTDFEGYNSDSGTLRVSLSDGTKFVDKGVWLKGEKPSFCGDFNGDGLADICYISVNGSDVYAKAAFSNGKAFQLQNQFKLANYAYEKTDKFFAGDFNGDGITDFAIWKKNIKTLFIIGCNNSWNSSIVIDDPKVLSDDYRLEFCQDFNFDGKSDLFLYNLKEPAFYVINLFGSGAKTAVRLNLDFDAAYFGGAYADSVQTGDFNGDGITDFLLRNFFKGTQIAYSTRNDMPDILAQVNNGWGGLMQFKYRMSSEYDYLNSGMNPKLPLTMPVVSEVVLTDGMGGSYTTTYLYSKGLFDGASREFRGFGYVRKAGPDSVVETWFQQDDIYKGKTSQQKIKDKDGNKYSEIRNTWVNSSPYPGTHIVSLGETNEYEYNGDSSCKQRTASFQYDAYGNQTLMKEWGDAAVSGDERETISEFAYNTTAWLVSYPAHTFVRDASANKLQEKWFYYDGAANFTTAPVKGLLAKAEAEAYNPFTQQRNKTASQYIYDGFGNLVKLTDALGRITSTVYDPDLWTYPAKVTNAAGQINQYTYDQRTGQVTAVIDPNQQKKTYEYDALGRLVKVTGPNDTASEPAITCQYDFSSAPYKVIKNVKSSYVTGKPDYLTTYSFFDGLGRAIQTKVPAKNDPQSGQARQIVQDSVQYDHAGRAKEKYLPYFVASESSYNRGFSSQPKFSYKYDCLGRQTQVVNPDGTYKQNAYSDWVVLSADENGHRTQNTYDGLGRVIKVEEYNGGAVYTTFYKYDGLNDLVEIVDNANNRSSFVYDSLGRRIRLIDPDLGSWDYEYDSAGNLIKQADNRRQVVEFTYDGLNRVKTKVSVGQTLAAYIYDDSVKQFCLGRLSKVVDTAGSVEYFYDRLGRQIKSIRSAGDSSFTVEQVYDALDRVISLKYPDGETVNYFYNPQGVEKISGASNYVTGVDYSPASQITRINYGNNTFTNYAYDQNSLRLKQIATQGPQGKIQDLNYSFDNAGNITGIQDNVNSGSQSFLYDDLNRLASAQGPYGAVSYSYDSLGNITNKEGNGYTYGSSKPHAVTSTSDGTTFEYDANGNLIRKTTSKGARLFIYDAENRLIRVEDAQTQGQPVKTLQLYLPQGVNYISLPNGAAQNIKDVLAAIQSSREEVVYWDANQNKYLYNVNNPDFNQFETLEYAKGYWIYINNAKGVTLNITFSLPMNYRAGLKAGWNAIGCPKDVEADVEAALKPLKIGADYTSVLRYGASGAFEEYSAAKKQFTKMKPGEGYWLKMVKDANWDIANAPAGLPQAEFVYDAAGSRVKKITPQKTTIYVGSLYEKDSDGAAHKHIFLGATRICTIDSTGSANYYHSDHLGSSNVLTDKNGARGQLMQYRPFGSLSRKEPSALATNYLFTGKELDAATDLYYYGARYYAHDLGKFTQPDPLIQDVYDPQTLNHYAYCRNNPLILTDPDGQAWTSTFSSWGSNIGSSISGGWNSFSNSISNSYDSAMRSMNNTWNNFQSSINSMTTQAMRSFNTAMTSLSNFSQSSLSGAKTWGNALVSGMNYGANTLAPPGTPLYKGADWVSNNIANPIYNTILQPGYNYGSWVYEDKSLKNFFGASLDSAWAITSIMSPIMGSSSSYYQYYGPNSNPASTWVTRTLYSPEVAMQKLSAPTEWNAMRTIDVPWYRWVGGPRIAAPKFEYPGGGIEYKIGGFGIKNWIEYLKDSR